MRSCSTNGFTRLSRFAAIFLIVTQSLFATEELELGMTEDQVWSILGDVRFQLKRGNDTYLTFDNDVQVKLTDGVVSGAEGIVLKKPVVKKVVTVSREVELEQKAKSLAEALKPKAKAPDEETNPEVAEAEVAMTEPEPPEEIDPNAPGYDPAEFQKSAKLVEQAEAGSNLFLYIGCGVGVLVLIVLVKAKSKKKANAALEDEEEFEEAEASSEPVEENTEEKKDDETPAVAVFKDPTELPEGKSEADLPNSIKLKPKEEPTSIGDLDIFEDTVSAIEKNEATVEEAPVQEKPAANNFPPPNFAKPEVSPATELEEMIAKTKNSKSTGKPLSKGVPTPDQLVALAMKEDVPLPEELEAEPESVLQAQTEAAGPVSEVVPDSPKAVEEEEVDDKAFEAALDDFLVNDLEDESPIEDPVSETSAPEAPAAEAPVENEEESEQPRLSLRNGVSKEVENVEESVAEVQAAAEEVVGEKKRKPRLRLSSK